MKTTPSKAYYKVKIVNAYEGFNSKQIYEFNDYENAKRMFLSSFENYQPLSVELKTMQTCFFSKCLKGEEDVLAYFGMALEFNSSPVWISPTFQNVY
ncbi:MAG: hypothetical protein IKJ50_04525 [Clostridia bacterium]|nr:hypothetical protein [Clostridia bacterium]